MAFSIHTIHRPLARSQRVPISEAFNVNARPPKKSELTWKMFSRYGERF